MKKLLGIVVLGLLWCNLGFSIDLSDYSEDERKQYKQIKKLKDDGGTGTLVRISTCHGEQGKTAIYEELIIE